MKTSFFTFGQSHVHVLDDGTRLDRDTTVKIVAEEPRDIMTRLFGAKWSMEYDFLPPLCSSRGVFEIRCSFVCACDVERMRQLEQKANNV